MSPRRKVHSVVGRSVRRKRKAGGKSHQFRPSLEALERRSLLALTPVNVTITRVIEHEDPDPFPFQGDGDYYSIVNIDNQGDQASGIVTGEDFNPGWTFSRQVDLTHNPVDIVIALKDEDDDEDDHIDINPADGIVAILIHVDLFTGHWTGNVTWPANSSVGDGDFEHPFEGGEKGELFFDVQVPSLVGPDSDGDGLLDEWETSGLDIDRDGSVELDLPALGADPNHKDLFVEIDSMVGLGPAAMPAITAASNALPIVVTSANHGLTTGTRVTIQGVTGNTAANGTFTVTRLDSDQFQLNGINGNGDYGGGGSWSLADLSGTGLATNTILDVVVDSFRKAPVTNPDGQAGINMHLLIDENDLAVENWDTDLDGDGVSPYGEDLNANQTLDCGADAVCGNGDAGDEDANNDGLLGDGDPDDQGGYAFYVPLKQQRFGTVAQRTNAAAANILTAKRLVYRYNIFANYRVDGKGAGNGVSIGSSGVAWTESDFIITLGTWTPAGGTPDEQAGTFMHELGHTLGLGHGGDSGVNFKPNYHSIMNYTWQLPNGDFPESWTLDYSIGTFPALDESSLNESAGIGGHAGHRVRVGPASNGPPAIASRVVNESGSVNWSRDDADGDGNASNDTGVPADINRVKASLAASPGEVLTDFNDWANIKYVVGAPGLTDGASPDFEPEEINFHDYLSLSGLLFYQAPTGNGADDLLLRKNGNYIEIVDHQTGAVLTKELAVDVQQVEVRGAATEGDTLRVSFSGGNPIPQDGVKFSGGTLSGTDTLRFEGTLPAPAVYLPDASGLPENGTISLGGLLVQFTGLEFVRPVNPEITGVQVSAVSVDEGGSITLTGQFLDPGSQSSHSVGVDWGDGEFDPLTSLALGDRSFSITHQYRDDNPTGTPADTNHIVVTVRDDDGLEDSATDSILVNNLPPEFTALSGDSPSSDPAEEGEPVTISGAFTDLGVLDTHEVTIDWGDGAVSSATVTESNGAGTFSGQHSFQFGGIYTIQLVLRDDDTGQDSATKTVFVTGVGIHEVFGKLVLEVIGSSRDDQVTVNQQGNGQITVHASFLPDNKRTLPLAGLDLVDIVLLGGNDHATISGNVGLPAVIDGGLGNDQLNAGNASSVVIGGGGADNLLGGSGNDILIGGLGGDRLNGNAGDDILVAGTTSYDSGADDDKLANDFALLKLLDEWTSNRNYSVRVSNVNQGVGPVLDGSGLKLKKGTTVFDDTSEDELTGASGMDWYMFGSPQDRVTDRKTGEAVN